MASSGVQAVPPFVSVLLGVLVPVASLIFGAFVSRKDGHPDVATASWLVPLVLFQAVTSFVLEYPASLLGGLGSVIVLGLFTMTATVPRWWYRHALRYSEAWFHPSLRPADLDQVQTRLERSVVERLLPRLPGSALAAPSPVDGVHTLEGWASVLVHSDPVRDVVVGVDLRQHRWDELYAGYVVCALFVPELHPLFVPIHDARGPALWHRFFSPWIWPLTRKTLDAAMDDVAGRVIQKGVPLLHRVEAPVGFADFRLGSPDSDYGDDPVSSEEAAYGYVLAGDDQRAVAILNALLAMEGGRDRGETKIGTEAMEPLRDRARWMRDALDGRRDEALARLASWRAENLRVLGLGG